MSVRFCVLGSGSSGNSALVMSPHANVLIDPGFSPLEISKRMKGTGVTWEKLDAVVLTHTHGDHIKKTCFRQITELKIPFYCHQDHVETVQQGRYEKRLLKANLIQPYQDSPFEVAGEFIFHPLHLPHDSIPTYGFKIETVDLKGQMRRVGYLNDLGHWTHDLAAQLNELDLLALEFNHDERLQRTSKRHPKLIARVLGALGHLSNDQAAGILEHVIRACPHGGPRRVVQMHLSGECNRPALAYQAAADAVERTGAHTKIYSTRQDQRGSIHRLDELVN